MFHPFTSIFYFLRRDRTEQTTQLRKPMAIPVASNAHNIQLGQEIFMQLDEAEAEVLSDINDPEKAWLFLTQIRQHRRETLQDLGTLSPSFRMPTEAEHETATSPVRTVMTRTGIQWSVFNGGSSH